MRIYHNIPALYAYNSLNATNSALQKSIRTLSTGLRINSAADDAAGLAISEKMRSQINGLNMAMRNAQDGISMMQTAEGALSEVHSILQRMRELSVQAANDTLTQQDRQYIQLEIDQLKSEIDRTSTATQFNKKRLLDGSSAGLWSSNDLATKAYIRGSLRQIDRFGQKAAFEGNYKIQINAKPGQAEAMKTDVFKIKHKNVAMGVSLNDQAGVSGLRVDNLPAGSYTVTTKVLDHKLDAKHPAAYDFSGASKKTMTVTAGGKVTTITLDTNVTDINGLVTALNGKLAGTGVLAEKYNTDTDIRLVSTVGEITLDGDVDAILGAGSPTTSAQIPPESAATLTGQYGFAFWNSFEAKTESFEFTDVSAAIAGLATKTLKITVGGKQIGGEITFAATDTGKSVLSAVQAELAKSTLKDVTLSAEMDTSGGGTKGKIVIKALKNSKEGTAAAGDVKIELTGTATNATPAAETPFNAAAADGVESKILDAKVFDGELKNNASVLFEVVSVNKDAKSVTLKATANILNPDGTVDNKVNDNIVLTEGEFYDLSESLGLGDKSATNPPDGTTGALLLQLQAGMTDKYAVGNKFVYNVNKKIGTAAKDITVEISGIQTETWPFKWGDKVTDKNPKFGLDADKVTEKELHFRNFYLNSKNGTVYEGDIVLKTNATKMTKEKTLATFEAAYIGQVAKKDVHLRDLDKFWDSQGRFLLTDPQTINIAQGDGKNTSITLYATDTLSELRSKLNGAIANGLEQARFAVSHANSFVTFVEDGTKQDYGLETVPGTFIIRSMIAGAAGKLSFAGDEDLIKALSLNVVQEASENAFTASIYDAHNGATVVNNVTVSGNQLIGVIHPNVDVEFDPMANIKVSWNEHLRNFELKKEDKPYETILHLVDNSTVFQVGANEGEDVAIDIGNMSSDALGVTRVIVTDRVSAARAISILDTAIGKVSTQRAKIGAFQNSLEHTVTNLTTTGTNLTAAESRIRDADMSQEMLNFTKLQILSQSGTAMLAQANQLPQTVLSLIRG